MRGFVRWRIEREHFLDSCVADSGGPLVSAKQINGDVVWFQLGIGKHFFRTLFEIFSIKLFSELWVQMRCGQGKVHKKYFI